MFGCCRLLDFHRTWCVGSGRHKCYPHGLSSHANIKCTCECVYRIARLHICSDWLITKKANIKNSVWATVTKLGICVEEDSSITHYLCVLLLSMRILSTV